MGDGGLAKTFIKNKRNILGCVGHALSGVATRSSGIAWEAPQTISKSVSMPVFNHFIYGGLK